MAQPTRTESSYHDVLDAFESIWRQESLPSDARLYIAGAINQAGVRQGDEIYPREISEKILAGAPLEKSELMTIMECIHEFVINKRALRYQYLAIVVHQTTSYLTRHYQHLAAEFQRKLAVAASQN